MENSPMCAYFSFIKVPQEKNYVGKKECVLLSSLSPILSYKIFVCPDPDSLTHFPKITAKHLGSSQNSFMKLENKGTVPVIELYTKTFIQMSKIFDILTSSPTWH